MTLEEAIQELETFKVQVSALSDEYLDSFIKAYARDRPEAQGALHSVDYVEGCVHGVSACINLLKERRE